MSDIKTIKPLARAHVKKHRFLLCVVCAISIFLGSEYSGIMTNAQNWYDILTGQETQLDAEGFREDRLSGSSQFTADVLEGDMAAGRREADERAEKLKAEADVNSPLGRSRGVLAALMNDLNSGRMYMTVASALFSMVRSGQVVVIIMILGSLLLYMSVWVFFRNFYCAVLRRVFLETRTYEAYPMNHVLFFALVNRWFHASMTLLLKEIYETLWSLTIVGFVVKRYSYFLVPFIVAENPDIKPNRAITLSRRMMDGHKWECFRLQMSFLGWLVLGYVTFGITDAVWGLPYRVAAYTEFYARLRAEAKAKGIEDSYLLNDNYLFVHADEEALQKAYGDVLAQEKVVDAEKFPLTPRQKFFARNFGIWLGSMEQKRVYAHRQGLKHQLFVARRERQGKVYPQRLNIYYTRKRAEYTGRVSYLTPCTVWSLVAVFFSFCMVGWLWEVSLHMITHGEFVNRGALHGPWLPIYGGGVVLISVLLFRFREKPPIEAAAIVVVCGIVEYFTSWLMELSRGLRWWDYTGYFLNLNGRICGEGLAVFAIGGMAAVYLLVPLIDAMITRIRNTRAVVGVCVALLICFTGDFVYSQFVPNAGAGITDDESAAALTADKMETETVV